MKNIFKMNKITLLLIIMGIVTMSVICFRIYMMDSYDLKEVFNEEGSVEKINIIPKPMSYQSKEGKFTLTKDSAIYIKGKNDEETEQIKRIAEFIREKLNASTGFSLQIITSDKPVDGSIYLTTINSNEELGNEGYEIDTTSKAIKITAYKPEGISRGVQTLRQLLPPEIDSNTIVDNMEWTVPASVIKDKPEYSYRGLMIDVARHFFTVDEIKRQIDLAAQYKINKVHLHLSDDQGWRLEIKKYPDLTLIGGSTEVGGGPGGYYTQDQFKDIVNFAMQRYVEIVPEFDMPGHTNAALASYGFLNPDGKRAPLYTGTEVGFSSFMAHSEKTYEFIDDVFNEVSQISPSKYLQIGGDEALNTKKEDYDYFVGRVAKIAEKYGKIPIGWDPIDTSPEIGSSVILQNWQDSNEEAVKKNMKILVSIASKAYLDMKYNEETPYGLNWAGYIPVDVAYKWDPTDYAPKNLVLGVEAPLWTETISTQDQMDYMIYPRLPGYAEIGWTPKENRNWDEYKVRLVAQEKRLTNEGVNYYKWRENNKRITYFYRESEFTFSINF